MESYDNPVVESRFLVLCHYDFYRHNVRIGECCLTFHLLFVFCLFYRRSISLVSPLYLFTDI